MSNNNDDNNDTINNNNDGEDDQNVLAAIDDQTSAFSHIPEHGFSLFLASRTKTVHFIRHGEGTHNAANRRAGDDSPVTHTTPGSWTYQDARLTDEGIQQCVKARQELLHHVHPELIVVSPFTRTLQTAHIMFGGKRIPFLVHEDCRERAGFYTCDHRRTKTEIVYDMQRLYEYTGDTIDFDHYGYRTEHDVHWTQEREASETVIARGIALVQWLASRPEREIAVVTHSSWLKHLFHQFGDHSVSMKDMEKLHRLAGNAEIRSVCLAMHHGFYPDGTWDENNVFVPHDHSFRRGRWAPSDETIAGMHRRLLNHDHDEFNKPHESMPI